MQRSGQLSDILGIVAGALFALLLFISVSSVDPRRGVSDQELLSWWSDSGNRDGFVLSMYTLLLACPLFLVFLSRLHVRLRAADPSGGWTRMVSAAGIVFTVALGVTAVTRGVVASAMRFEGDPLPGVDTLRFATNLSYAAWDLVILFAVVLILGASILVLTTHVLPRWLGWLGIVMGVGSAVIFALQAAPLSIPLLIIWVLANSFQIFRTRGATFPATNAARAGIPIQPAPALSQQR